MNEWTLRCERDGNGKVVIVLTEEEVKKIMTLLDQEVIPVNRVWTFIENEFDGMGISLVLFLIFITTVLVAIHVIDSVLAIWKCR